MIRHGAGAYRDRIVTPVRGVLPDSVVKVIEGQLSGACTTEFAALLTDAVLTHDYDHIIFDTAPAGHTLLLLDATGAYHRDIVRQMESTHLHFTTPMMQLQDPRQTKVLFVTLAETTPVLEAANLQADLKRAGIEPWTWIINNSVAAASVTAPVTSPLLRQRAHNELIEIESVVT